MGNASNVQTDFRGGEWSPFAQGRLDDPEYKRGMNVCRNVHPIETGAAVRRCGTRFLGFTHQGQEGKVIPFSFTQAAPYTMEFTDGHLRFYNSTGPVMAEAARVVTAMNGAAPCQMTTFAAANSWATGDTVVFQFPAQDAPTAAGYLLGRQFTIVQVGDDEHWQLYDAVTGQPLDGSLLNWTPDVAIGVQRIFDLTTPYLNGTWESLRYVQDQDSVMLLHPTIQPYTLFSAVDGGNLFTLAPVQFIDGPYLDPPIDGSELATTALTGQITLSLTYPAWSSLVSYSNGGRFFSATAQRTGQNSLDPQYQAGSIVTSGGSYYVSIADNNLNHMPPNASFWKLIQPGFVVGPNGFQATDVGRSIRLYSEPELYDPLHAYTVTNQVTYNGQYWVSLIKANTGIIPGSDAVSWAVSTNASEWTWGIITTVNSDVSVTITLIGPDILYTQPIRLWRLGAYSDSTTYPTNGVFHEGRIWLGGAIKNRFDGSKSDGNTYDFTPTGPDGTVADDNAISYTLTAPQQNQLLWMLPGDSGIVCGTAQGEWLIRSTQNDDPITPTSIQAKNVTKLGSNNQEAVRAGTTIAFVQRQGQKVYEYLADLFSGKLSGLNLSEKAKHLTTAGVKRLAYQQELAPIIWAVTNDKKLIGTTYKRESMMVSQPPSFNGWHRHDLGSGFDVIDICSGASPNGLIDSVTMITQDPATGFCRVEVLTEMLDENSTINDAWFLDCAVVPQGAIAGTVNGIAGITFTGMGHLEGKLVTGFIGQLDVGDYTVTNGQIFVPFQADPGKLFTLAYIQALSAGTYQYGTTVYVPATAFVQTIMQFPPVSQAASFTYLNYGNQAVVDWARNRVTFLLPGTGPLSGFVQYNLTTGALIMYQPISAVFGLFNPPYYDATVTYASNPFVTGSDGMFYTAISANSLGVNPTTSGQKDWVQIANPTSKPANFNSGTSYALGAYTFDPTDQYIYKSLISSNVGNTPHSSPVDWQRMFQVPAAWSNTTNYGPLVRVTGSNNVIFYSIQAVPAASGDPFSFPNNNNPYWVTQGKVYPFIITNLGLGLDRAGDIYMYEGNNFGPYVKVNGTTLTASGFSTTNNQVGITTPAPSGGGVPIRILNNQLQKDQDYMVWTVPSTPFGTTAPAVIIVDSSSMIVSESGTLTFDEGASAIACPGSIGIGNGSVYAMTIRTPGNAAPFIAGLYVITANTQNPDGAQRAIGNTKWGFGSTGQNGTVTGGINVPGATYVNNDGGTAFGSPNAHVTGNQPQDLFQITRIGDISPPDIDPLWIWFASQTGLCYDQADGNVMSVFQTQNPAVWASGTTYGNSGDVNDAAVGSDGKVYVSKTTGNINHDPTTDAGVHWTLTRNAVATNLFYVAKMSTNDATVLWTVAANEVTGNPDMFSSCNVADGVLIYDESLGTGHFQGRYIETLTGNNSIFTVGDTGFAALGSGFSYNSLTSSAVIYPQYDHSHSGTPTPVGATPSSFTGWGLWTITRPEVPYIIPAVVGFTYTSQGQRLRPVAPQETGARNGPAFGKTRRNHRYAMSVAQTQGIYIGCAFGQSNLNPAIFKTPGGTAYAPNTLYTNEHSATITDTYSYDGMLCWQVTRPLPATMLAFGGFLETEDR